MDPVIIPNDCCNKGILECTWLAKVGAFSMHGPPPPIGKKPTPARFTASRTSVDQDTCASGLLSSTNEQNGLHEIRYKKLV